MSVIIALPAKDGIVVFADGRTTFMSGDRPPLDSTEKLVIAPQDFPFVVGVAGRARVGGETTHTVTSQCLYGMNEGTLDDLRLVSDLLVEEFASRSKSDPLKMADEKGDLWFGTSFLVAGYSNAKSPSPQIWTAEVLHKPVPAKQEHLQLVMMPTSSDSEGHIYDCFDRYAQLLDCATQVNFTTTYKYQDLNCVEIRQRAEAELRKLSKCNTEYLRSEGIGGRWMVAQVQPEGSVTVDYADIGPWDD